MKPSRSDWPLFPLAIRRHIAKINSLALGSYVVKAILPRTWIDSSALGLSWGELSNQIAASSGSFRISVATLGVAVGLKIIASLTDATPAVMARLTSLQGMKIWRRPIANQLTVLDADTARPLAGVEVGVLVKGKLTPSGTTDSRGQCAVAKPYGQRFRLACAGYHTVNRRLDSMPATLLLKPLVPNYAIESITRRAHFTMVRLSRDLFILGSLFLAWAFFNDISIVFFWVAAGYSTFWLGYLLYHSQPKLKIRVIDNTTQKPVVGALVAVINERRRRVYFSDRVGQLSFPYPPPDSVTVIKSGYDQLTPQAVSAVALSSEGLIIPITKRPHHPPLPKERHVPHIASGR